MTATAFVLPSEQDEWNELERLTGSLAQPTDDVVIDAVASDALRIMAGEDAEIARYQKALEAEMQRIVARYASLSEPHEKRRLQAEAIVEECAKRAQFVGKAKSRKVGYGVYGRKTIPERVTIIDQAKALAFAKRYTDTALIKVKTEETVVHAAIVPLVLAQLHGSGVVPEGFEHVGAHEEVYAKPIGATE